jgi:hypothetical protein
MFNAAATPKSANDAMGASLAQAAAPINSFLLNARSAANVAANAAANAAKNVGTFASNAVKTNTVSALNAANSAANALKETPFGVVTTPFQNSIKTSINAVPDSAPSLFVSLPLIVGIGVLVILFLLVVTFRQQITGALSALIAQLRAVLGYSGAAVDTAVESVETDVEAAAAQLNLIETVAPTRKQVFNVSENKYTYSDAEPLCKALGAELATYDQVKNAWEKGADWCNYGWIKGQGAVYPTQQTTFDKLQQGSSDDERLACGQPGINGGYFDNPQLRFGVNCYGDKPAESEHDMKKVLQNQVPPLTAEGLASLKKELRYKQERSEIGVLPFRQGAWSS